METVHSISDLSYNAGNRGSDNKQIPMIDEFAIGPVVRKNLGLLVGGEQPLREDVAVILGEDFFRQFDIEFDLPHDMAHIILSPKPLGSGTGLALLRILVGLLMMSIWKSSSAG